MSRETDFDAAGTAIFADLGQTATFTAAGPTVYTCQVNVDTDVAPQPGGFTGQMYDLGTTIETLLDQVGGTEPVRGETFLVGTTTYTVVSTVNNDGRFVKLQVR